MTASTRNNFKPVYKVTRVFHPVGQGAFYSESHSYDDAAPYTVVYDCGTKKDQNWLKSRITASGIVNPDLMFLSHFHDDHYKGIKFLNPKVIILPIMKEWDRVIFWIGSRLNHSGFNPNFTADLQKRFPNSRIIQIQPADEETEYPTDAPFTNIDEIPNPEDTDSFDTHGNIFPSGTRFNSSAIPDWIYIPVNPCLDMQTVQQFEDLVKAYRLDEDKLKALDTQYFKEKIDQLKNIYNAIGSPNEYSMAVYSGPSNSGMNLVHFDTNLGRICSCPPFPHVRRFCPFFEFVPDPGCLYFGDMNLNNSLDPLKIIYRYLGNDLQEMIGTIQVPHHGSKDNYNSKLLKTFDLRSNSWTSRHHRVVYVISVGESNSYGHPNGFVMNELITSGHFLKLVTEDHTSDFAEVFAF